MKNWAKRIIFVLMVLICVGALGAISYERITGSPLIIKFGNPARFVEKYPNTREKVWTFASSTSLYRRQFKTASVNQNPNIEVDYWLFHLIRRRYIDPNLSVNLQQPGNGVFQEVLFVGISNWLVAFISAIYPAYFLFASQLEKRMRKQGSSSCPQCGYNLTGNGSGICPECGELVEAAE